MFVYLTLKPFPQTNMMYAVFATWCFFFTTHVGTNGAIFIFGDLKKKESIPFLKDERGRQKYIQSQRPLCIFRNFLIAESYKG